MEDNLVEDVSREASLVVEGVERNRGNTLVAEAPGQQQTNFGEKLPQDTSFRREAKERWNLRLLKIIGQSISISFFNHLE